MVLAEVIPALFAAGWRGVAVRHSAKLNTSLLIRREIEFQTDDFLTTSQQPLDPIDPF